MCVAAELMLSEQMCNSGFVVVEKIKWTEHLEEEDEPGERLKTLNPHLTLKMELILPPRCSRGFRELHEAVNLRIF